LADEVVFSVDLGMIEIHWLDGTKSVFETSQPARQAAGAF